MLLIKLMTRQRIVIVSESNKKVAHDVEYNDKPNVTFALGSL
jgi:hypothetical protein